VRNYFITKISLWSLSIGAVASALPTDVPADPVTFAALLENYGPAGILAIAVWALWKKSEKRTEHDDKLREEKDKQFIAALQEQTKAITKLKVLIVKYASALRGKCGMVDDVIREDEEEESHDK
jgi:vacuolar-type H+-ATPase subunit I/STV1